MSDNHEHEALISPGSTATGSGTGIGENPESEGLADAEQELGTTEADVSDGSEQKQQPID